ncbi:MAG: ABC transporter substrate-binding protein [Clostridia bacterium]|nr:ABC transporter substrate-binding protein [Clostridia bacterium]
MKKTGLMKVVVLLAVIAMVFASCAKEPVVETPDNPAETQANDTPVSEEPVVEEYSQGVTDTTIYVGNTAAVSGALAVVGVPFNDAIMAYFKMINDAGGIDGRMIEFITYDDGFDGATGAALTEKLAEEDEVFALVGHFGTPTVSATVDYIQEIGIPMVYAATGINALYFEESPMNPVMAVQPIYMTDGRIMAARAFNEELFGGAMLPSDAVIGVLYTNDDAGSSILAGVQAEAAAEGRDANMVVEAVAEGTYATGVQKLKDAGAQVVILAMNQVPFKETLVAMDDAQMEVPVFTSYVNADVTAVDHTKYSENRPIYTNAWVDVYSEKGQADVQDYVACIAQADLAEDVKTAYYTNSFATAGYIAAVVFVEGLKRLEANGQVPNWDNYIAAMEEGPIDIPMGGTVDYSGGKRWGIDSMSLLQYTVTEADGAEPTEAFVKVREIEVLSEIAGN